MPPPPQRHRHAAWPWVVLIVVALVAGSAITVVAVTVRGVVGRASAAPGPFGDLRLADPCSLIDEERLQQFGKIVVYPDIGPASACTAEIDVGAGSLVDVEVTLATPTAFVSAGEPEIVGELTVLRRVWTTSFGCGHTIETRDGSQVLVTARASLSATTNICGFADAGVDGAVPKLASGQVGKRSIDVPSNSLLDVDVCELVEPGDSVVPNLDVTRVEPGYGGWACTFGAPNVSGPWAHLEVQFSGSRDRIPTETIAGRTVIALEEETGSVCSMRIVQRDYTNAENWQRTEGLMVRVLAGPAADREAGCRGARQLIETIAPRLPHPS
ncbi:hypothetical protein WEH80_21520 [Actinomycetes bacterium KLBMP 9759]